MRLGEPRKKAPSPRPCDQPGPAKTAIIFSHAEGGGSFTIGGEQVHCLAFGAVITALGSPITFGESVAAIITEMNHGPGKPSTRTAGYCAPLHPSSGGSLCTKGWSGQAWPITDAILRAINSTQLQQICRMMHPGRRPGETWGEWNLRTLRGGRSCTAAEQSFALEHLSTAAHVGAVRGHGQVQAWGAGRAVVAQPLWWEGEKTKPKKQRVTHVHRYNAFVDPERQLVHVAALEWMQVAQDRQRWASLAAAFVQQYDVPWATGKQGSIQNLSPNHVTGRRGEAVASQTTALPAT